MALLNQSVQVYGQLPKFLETLRQGQAPTTFSRQFLKDIDFTSSNHLQFIPLLKGLGFLTQSGVPTERYKRFLDGTQWRKVIAEAVKEAYDDIFVLKARPTDADRDMIAGKFKSTYNLSDTGADRAARTFLALLNLSDQDALYGVPSTKLETPVSLPATDSQPEQKTTAHKKPPLGLQYNIQIHLPATKDIEVYNSIFRSLRDHLID